MGKRSDFERIEKDYYVTPREATPFLLPFLEENTRYCEPMAGNGAIIRHLSRHGHKCTAAYDIEPKHKNIILKDALTLTKADLNGADCIITNPPWRTDILHPAIHHFSTLAPTWLLFYSDWAYTLHPKQFKGICRKIVATSRFKWIPGTKHTGKENCAWYLFDGQYAGNPEFIFRRG